MNAGDAIKLSRWVERQRSLIGGRTMKQNADAAANDLGFKVATSALRDVMKAHGLQTRRKSEATVKIESLTADRDRYKGLLLKVVTATQVPEWLRDELLADEGLNEQLRDALSAKSAR